uniref:Uncharacterized protein n=1 Tax=Arundo donax TaxID=35708 RepID=A0A0A9H0H7_ARUDO
MFHFNISGTCISSSVQCALRSVLLPDESEKKIRHTNVPGVPQCHFN